MPPPGKKNVRPPEKEHHTDNMNSALTDALKNWNGEPREAIIRLEASISPNPGGISQYRVYLEPGGTPAPPE